MGLAVRAMTSLLIVSACGPGSTDEDASVAQDGSIDTLDGFDAADATVSDAGPEVDAFTPCATRITYGSAWLRPDGRMNDHDDVEGRVTWDGVCHLDAAGNSYAELSNGWRPYFRGASSCIIALDLSGTCSPSPSECTTRITYGASWLRAPEHPADYDDVSGVVTWDGSCEPAGGDVSAPLSNGWQPHFSGGCDISFRYEQCGGLYANPVVATDCPDPGVVHDGTQYVMACTGGGFPLRTSEDLVHWTPAGRIFAEGSLPAWAVSHFWAPEIHRVDDRFVAYFSARHADGSYALGAATASSALGPYTDIGRPLLHDPTPGVIDVHFFEAPDGARYLTWKVDGNDVGAPTPIYIQPLETDGITLTGTRREILRNDRAWEGAVVEGQWMIHHEGTYYLFYSGNAYATSRYGVGVARASDPLGPFEKLGSPILTSNDAFHGPGHGSVVTGPSGDLVHVYHSWLAGQAGGGPGRVVLVDRIAWIDGWPRMNASPSPRSQPMP